MPKKAVKSIPEGQMSLRSQLKQVRARLECIEQFLGKAQIQSFAEEELNEPILVLRVEALEKAVGISYDEAEGNNEEEYLDELDEVQEEPEDDEADETSELPAREGFVICDPNPPNMKGTNHYYTDEDDDDRELWGCLSDAIVYPTRSAALRTANKLKRKKNSFWGKNSIGLRVDELTPNMPRVG